jgi:hypothetical protein
MRYQLFFISIWAIQCLNAQHKLVVKTETPELLMSAAHSIQHLSDDYYLIQSTNPITINKEWGFSLSLKQGTSISASIQMN